MNKKQKIRSSRIIVWRDSVAAADDVFPRHEKRIKLESSETIESVLEKILAIHYLPSIQGGKATWIAVGKKPFAVIAQQWSKPHYFVETVTPAEDLVEFAADHQVEFRYWCQVEPIRVIESIEHGKPLPDKYGRD